MRNIAEGTRLAMLPYPRAPTPAHRFGTRRNESSGGSATRALRWSVNSDDPIPALKRQLGAELAQLLAGWRASDICDRIGTEAARVSDLRRGRLERFSLETLIRYLTRLRRRVDLVVVVVESPKRRGSVPS